MKTIDAAAAASQRAPRRHGRPVADRHLPRGLLQASALQEAKKRGIPMQTHACQAVVEFHEMMHRHGKTPIEWLDAIGVLGPDLVIGHGIFLDDHPQIHYPHAHRLRAAERDSARRSRIARPCSRAAAWRCSTSAAT